ncbi:Tyrosine recombinase XerD, partial [termite gut metagenome]
MASYKFLLFSGNKRQDGSFPVSLRVTKDRKVK